MSQRPITLETLRFALEILSLIPSRQYKTASQIHFELTDSGVERDLRSVQRMLKMLVEEYPGLERYSAHMPFGYKWLDQAPKIMLPCMSSTEALLLVMSRNYLQKFFPLQLNNALHSYFDEADSVLNAKLGDESTKDWLNKVSLSPPTQPLIPPPIKPDILDVVTHCLFNNLTMSMTYRNRQGEIKDHVTNPLGLIDRAPTLYLAARSINSETPEKTVTFALHRMVEVKETNITFKRPENFDLDAFVKEGRHMYGTGAKVQLSFEISQDAGQHLLESKLAKDQVMEDLGGWYRVSAVVYDSLELKKWLNGFGDDVRNVVREPIED